MCLPRRSFCAGEGHSRVSKERVEKGKRRGVSELAFEGAAGGRCLEDYDFAETRKLGGEFFPEPSGHALDSGAFESLDVVEVAMIELIEEGVHGVGDSLVVIDPADPLIDRALDRDLDLETVAMHATAFVIFR